MARDQVYITGSIAGQRLARPFRPYIRRIDDDREQEIADQLTAVRTRLRRARRDAGLADGDGRPLTSLQLLDVQEAVDGPDPEWHRELLDVTPGHDDLPREGGQASERTTGGNTGSPAADLPASEAGAGNGSDPAPDLPAPAIRCEGCGYVLARCDCAVRFGRFS